MESTESFETYFYVLLDSFISNGVQVLFEPTFVVYPYRQGKSLNPFFYHNGHTENTSSEMR